MAQREAARRRGWSGPAAVLALTTLWIAQPLYDLVGSMPEYFLVRGLAVSGPWLSDVWIFVLGAFLLPPVLLVALAELAGRLGGRFWKMARRRAYDVEVGALMAWGTLLALRLLDVTSEALRIPAWLALATALAVGVLAARGRRRPAVSQILVLVAILAPAAPVLFLLRPEIRAELATPLRVATVEAIGPAADVPVVVVVFDELPLATLLTPDGAIDGDRFPHMAQLASTATWHRGAVTPQYFTQLALPALTAGVRGDDDRLATARSYPRTVFSLLRRSHRVVSDEPMTALDPARRPAPPAGRLGAMSADAWRTLLQAGLPETWAARLPRPELRRQVGAPADPTERFLGFLGRVETEIEAELETGGERPVFVFSHLMLPHHPWLRDADGELYDPGDELLIAGLADHYVGAVLAPWQDDWETVLDAYERHVAQTRHADALLGRLLDLLRRAGIFDRALIVVTADHGIHFEPGAPARQPTEESAESLARIPLLVKLPGQTDGVVDDSPRSSLDLLPTILDVLGVDLDGIDFGGSDFEGRPLTAPSEHAPPGLVAFQELRERWFERLAAAGAEGFGAGWQQLTGVRPRLGGVPTRDWVVSIDRAGRFESVAADLPPPRRLSGRLLPRRPEVLAEAVEAGRSLPLAVAVDGVFVAATASSLPRQDRDEVSFSMLLPAGVMTAGEHQVVVYLVGTQDDAAVALPVPRVEKRLVRLADGELQIGRRRLPLTRTEEGEPPAGAAALRFDGLGALTEIFGVSPATETTAVEAVYVFRGETLLAEATLGDREAFGGRYQVGRAGAGTPELFRAVVPSAVAPAPGDLRVVAVVSTTTERLAVELPLEHRRESAWRITGPFRLHRDPRSPARAYQNY